MNNYLQQAAESIKNHEGLRLHPYKCTAGKTTIGYGRNLDDVGIDLAEAESLLQRDIALTDASLHRIFDFYEHLTERRKAVLIDMAYNLGMNRFKKFRKMITALDDNDYDEAALQMLDSRWAAQVGQRSITLSNQMQVG